MCENVQSLKYPVINDAVIWLILDINSSSEQQSSIAAETAQNIIHSVSIYFEMKISAVSTQK